MRRLKYLIPVLLTVVSLTALPAWAEEESPLEAKALKAAGLELDLKQHEARVDGTVCLDKGVLEYLVCLPNTFEHEAVFSVKCRPSVLHLTLLAVGLEPYAFEAGGDWWADAREQQRSRVRIEVEYEKDGQKVRRPISDFLGNREREDAVVADSWVFTGSCFFQKDGKRRYAADATGAVIGLGQEGASVLQYGERAGNPYRGDEQGLEINANTVPPVGTKVTLIFAPREEKSPPAKDP